MATLLARPRTADPLFRAIEEVHEARKQRYGVIMDAGTGGHSLKWLATLPAVDRIVAVSADLSSGEGKGAHNMRSKLGDNDVLVQGSWCTGHPPVQVKCDTILCDYLLGSMDGFTPYEQDRLVDDLLPFLQPDGLIHFVGLQPIYTLLTPTAYRALTDAQRVVVDVARLRDACILLAAHRPYREYPVAWLERHLNASGLDLVAPPRKYSVLWKHATVKTQLNVARRKLPYFNDAALATATEARIDALDTAAATLLGTAGVSYGFDYVVSAARRGDR